MSSRNVQLVLGAVGLALSLPGAAQELVNVPRADGAKTALRVYSAAKDCALLAVISPGAGGTEEGYAYLANGLRDSGWLAVVMGHKESGPATAPSNPQRACYRSVPATGARAQCCRRSG